MDHSWQGGFYGYIAQGAVALRKGIPESDFSTVGGLHAEFLAGPKEQRLAPPEVEGVADEAVQNRTEIEEKILKKMASSQPDGLSLKAHRKPVPHDAQRHLLKITSIHFRAL